MDVVLGYDDVTYYRNATLLCRHYVIWAILTDKLAKDPGHPVYNAIPGRYVNRIGNATYKLDGKTYKTETNDGNNTLHSGTNNWSYRFWNVTALSNDSITFSISDPADSEKGMPGLVNASVTYSVSGSTWSIKMEAIAPEAKTRGFLKGLNSKISHD